jgi:hypothetical protein
MTKKEQDINNIYSSERLCGTVRYLKQNDTGDDNNGQEHTSSSETIR